MSTEISLQAKKELLIQARDKYCPAKRLDKIRIINSLAELTGYGRKYIITLLNHKDSKVMPKPGSVTRNKVYNEEVKRALLTVWQAANCICGKRLAPFLEVLVTKLEYHGYLRLPDNVRTKLLSISAATIDRLLNEDRKKNNKGLSTTRGGSLLKKQIKVKTFADWDETAPGFFEADLVAHCGESVRGSFLNTLVITDIPSGWTEFLPIMHKGEAEVIAALEMVLELLPFKLQGLDTDNGSEFINYGLLNFCQTHQITFTRSRAYRKNDQAHVEEKNGSIVRRLLGYERYEGLEAFNALTAVYKRLRYYVNFFQPSLKLISKERQGAKVFKKYDKAKTPYQRLLESEYITDGSKAKLQREYDQLDPVQLLREVSELRSKFWELACCKVKEQNNDLSKSKGVIRQQPNIKAEVLEKVQEKTIPSALSKVSIELTKVRKSKRPYRKPLIPRTYRTRVDPLINVWPQISLALSINPARAAKDVLIEFMKIHPDSIGSQHLRTLQRRVKKWRIAQETNHSVKKFKASNLTYDWGSAA